MPVRPWSKLGVDIANLDGRLLLICMDYYSSYIEVGRLSSLTTQAVTHLLAEWMARHGIPDEVVSDNGRQFMSEDFQKFTRDWDFVHTTSSPLYPQSNGKAGKRCGHCQQLFKKSRRVWFLMNIAHYLTGETRQLKVLVPRQPKDCLVDDVKLDYQPTKLY